MTIRKVERSVALGLILAVNIALLAPSPAAAKRTCMGRRATLVGSRRAERIIGTPRNDVIVALAGADEIYARGGNDLVCGGGGRDVVLGEEDADRLDGGPGIDFLFGGGGNDKLELGGGLVNGGDGGDGDDSIVGNDLLRGIDLAGFSQSSDAVTVDLQAGTATGNGRDTLEEIEGAVGTPKADTLLGDAGTNVLFGGSGNDSIDGRGNLGNTDSPLAEEGDLLYGDGISDEPPGNDTLTGGSGLNIAVFAYSEAPVQVDLGTGTATGEGVDTLNEIQFVMGSRFDDTLRGDDGDNGFDPYLGNDTIDGGEGEDVLALLAPSGVTASLETGIATANGERDTFSAIENLWGS
ncbi:MAG TPA: calcium-binding protein, partial [Actinomycetota bacterium]|nr:calcium-binding protein [Actinomycetota bacterium]